MRVAPSVVPGGVSSPLLPRAPPSRQPHGSRCRLYARVAACFVGSMLSSGVLVSFPTLEPILLDQRPGVVRFLPNAVALVVARSRLSSHVYAVAC